jgi:hypothetical protein
MKFAVGDLVTFHFPLSERIITGYVEKIGYDEKVKVIIFNKRGQESVSYWFHPNNKHLKKVCQ